jgi:hypothetical protein
MICTVGHACRRRLTNNAVIAHACRAASMLLGRRYATSSRSPQNTYNGRKQ